MPEPLNSFQEEFALRTGLQQLYSAQPSAHFDSQVLAALQQPLPWWQNVWQTGKPMIASAGFSLVVMLILISASSQTPMPTAAPSMAVHHVDVATLDSVIDQPNLRADALIREVPPTAPDALPKETSPTETPDRHALPVRKAGRSLRSGYRSVPIA